MSEYYCPNCGADIGEQKGFTTKHGNWTCTECGQYLTDSDLDEDEKSLYGNVGWYCDGCGAFLNKQRGFDDYCGIWTCKKCGYDNLIDSSEIYETKQDYYNSTEKRGAFGMLRSLWNMLDGDEDDEDEDDEDNDEYNDNDQDEYQDSYGNENEHENYDQEITREYKEKKRAEIIEDIRLRWEQEEVRRRELQLRRAEKREVRIEKYKTGLTKAWRTLARKTQSAGFSSDQYRTMHYGNILRILEQQEFYNVTTQVIEDLGIEEKSKEGLTEVVLFNGQHIFDTYSKFPYNARIVVVFHALRKALPPLTSKKAKKMDVNEVTAHFFSAGFANVQKAPIPDLKRGWLVKNNSVERIYIDGRTDFKKKERIRIDALVTIAYHTFRVK